ncbi:hypothetical protein [Hymenobacter cellulosilyticus]|uniref:Sugar ABC transporter ATPase n=1 Tax=Hymenobacter cellulosilyticus TaxID=2932248 RepID=A0A8T9QA14_9BACT|nr:hypothetical protein [Hymenobacter cellulosilyticus]UOQ73985.1 hypothetical protein MUN79_08860 [Hymenobacter cellulosilyticus]
MSDHSTTIVPALSAYPGKEDKAKEILNWLVAEDIIKPTLSDCVLSASGGYAIAEGARAVIGSAKRGPFDLAVNGLEIVTERQVFDTGGNGVEELICPSCDQDLAAEDWSFIDDWYQGHTNDVVCPVCNTAADIHLFRFTPVWGFSDLGFRFWNLPDLTEAFINRFQQKLGCTVSVVYQRI